MRPLRHPLVLRALALVLLAGTGAACVPTAEARDARADALRSFLDDADAVEHALRAARASEGDAAAAFADAYAEAAGEAVSAEAVRQLLRGQGVGSVAPVLPDHSFVPAPPAGPLVSASAAVVGASGPAPALRGVGLPALPPAAAVVGGAGRSVQARGP